MTSSDPILGRQQQFTDVLAKQLLGKRIFWPLAASFNSSEAPPQNASGDSTGRAAMRRGGDRLLERVPFPLGNELPGDLERHFSSAQK